MYLSFWILIYKCEIVCQYKIEMCSLRVWECTRLHIWTDMCLWGFFVQVSYKYVKSTGLYETLKKSFKK